MDSGGGAGNSTLLDPSQQHPSCSLSTHSSTQHGRNRIGGSVHQTGGRDFSTCSSAAGSPPAAAAQQEPSMRQQLISVSDQARSSLAGASLIGHEQNKSDQTTTTTRHDAASAVSQTAAPAKSHSVGPVMGIFFKVWSLVKVTKGRHHQNRLRRQQSEDASQFQYISGDRFASAVSAATNAAATATASPDKQTYPAAATTTIAAPAGAYHLSTTSSGGRQLPPTSAAAAANGHTVHLHDSQFRRARSQPASSRLSGGQQSVATPISGTNSSSSGVSSANSTAEQQQQQGGRSLAAAGTGAGTGAGEAAGKTYLKRDKAAPSEPTAKTSRSTSWTSRIKRSATSVNHRRDETKQLRGHLPRQLDSAPVPERAQSDTSRWDQPWPRQQQQQPHQQQRRRHINGLALKSSYDDDDDEDSVGVASDADHDADEDDNCDRDDDDGGGEWHRSKLTLQRQQQSIEADDDDTNDIYSTPNDSIQSVQSTAAASGTGASLTTQQFQSKQQQQQQPLGRQSNPIMKSFSTNNFSHIIGRQQTNNNSNPITRNESCDSKGSNSKGPRKRNNPAVIGSRFFISSSSSSEDSNQQQQQQVPQVQQQLAQQQPPKPIQLEQRRAQYPVQLALHYHEPAMANGSNQPAEPQLPARSAAARPNSLHFVQANVPASLATPMAPRVHWLKANNNGQSAVASAMSPMTTGNVPLQQPPPPLLLTGSHQNHLRLGAYRKSPSLFEMSSQYRQMQIGSNSFVNSSRQQRLVHVDNHHHQQQQQHEHQQQHSVPISISLHDCKLVDHVNDVATAKTRTFQSVDQSSATDRNDEYKLAQMLLEVGSNRLAKDQHGNTALMLAIMSDNLAATKCLVEHGVDLNETNDAEFSALDLICCKEPNDNRLVLLQLLIDNRADFDRSRESDGSRLLDRLISEHCTSSGSDKLRYIDCLLQNGAKLGSSTWLAANGKRDVQLRLLRKLCQDGYFLYKKCSIEAAVFRFEYALKRITELELQLSADCSAVNLPASNVCCKSKGYMQNAAALGDYYGNTGNNNNYITDQMTLQATQQLKYQTYLGLSRCERKRKFYKRALDFAHMSILVDSTSYEGYYSKAHILKDLGELDDSLFSIDQTSRLVDKSLESVKYELNDLAHQEEALIFDNCFDVHNASRSSWFEATRIELINNVEYLAEAKRHISRLRSEIIQDKHNRDNNNNNNNNNAKEPIAGGPIDGNESIIGRGS